MTTWVRAETSKPKQSKRVLLKIIDEDCPVVGFWGCSVFEACTVNMQVIGDTYDDFEVDGSFKSDDVTHWAEISLP